MLLIGRTGKAGMLKHCEALVESRWWPAVTIQTKRIDNVAWCIFIYRQPFVHLMLYDMKCQSLIENNTSKSKQSQAEMLQVGKHCCVCSPVICISLAWCSYRFFFLRGMTLSSVDKLL